MDVARNNAAARGDARKGLAMFTLGVVGVFSAHNSLLNLQSSLNIEESLGTTSLSVLIGCSIAFGVFASPVLLRFVNVKYGLLASDLALLTFILANFYPHYATLIPASALAGIGRGVCWVCVGPLIYHFAVMYHKCGSRDLLTYIAMVNGYFFCGFLFTHVLGNLIPFVVFELSTVPTLNTSNFTTDEPMNTTTDNRFFSVAETCGANDCQDPSLISDNSSQYQPASREAIYYVMGAFLILNVIGFILHVVYTPSKLQGLESNKNDASVILHHVNEAFEMDGTPTDRRQPLPLGSKEDINNNNTNDDDVESARKRKGSDQDQYGDVLREAWWVVKHYWMFYIKPKQLLLASSQILVGLNSSFVATEITRAYISCVFGVAEVGIAMSIFGVMSLISAFIAGKTVSKFDRLFTIYFAFILNIGTFLFCLLWVPDEDAGVGILHGLLCFCGIIEGIYQSYCTVAIAVIFDKDFKRAFACSTVMVLTGFFITFTWSAYVCVRYKIYAQLVVLLVAATSYGILEFWHRKKEHTQQTAF